MCCPNAARHTRCGYRPYRITYERGNCKDTGTEKVLPAGGEYCQGAGWSEPFCKGAGIYRCYREIREREEYAAPSDRWS